MKAVSVQPGNWQFQANLAMALFELRRLDDALAAYRQAARLNPKEPSLQMGIANCLALRGDLPEAETQLRKITQQHPRFAFAWFNLGNVLRDAGRAEEAIQQYRRAISTDAGFADAYTNLGTVLLSMARFHEAEPVFRKAVDLDTNNPVGHCNLASLLIDVGRFPEAEAECRKAILLDPALPLAHSFLASALGYQGNLRLALASSLTAARLAPDDPRALWALGTSLHELGRTEEGIRNLERALTLQPDAPHIRATLATLMLSVGEFDEGWRNFTSRAPRVHFQAKHPAQKTLTTLQPDPADKDLCILREQGLGDELFFLRYVHRLKREGLRITYHANPKLVTLLERAPLLEDVIVCIGDPPPAEALMLAGDLPLAAAALDTCDLTTASQIVTPTRRELLTGFKKARGLVYAPVLPPLALAPLDESLIKMQGLLSSIGPPPYTGITWRGGLLPEQQTGKWSVLYKHAPIEPLANSFRARRGTLIALQRSPFPGEIEQFSGYAGRELHDFSRYNDELEDMLALLALIDDYVGVSNTNMHLRAGVNRTARVLMPCPAEWRWMLAGRESPWFPGFVIYRQTSDGDWSPALAELASDLARTFGN
jgi:Flp pilus assembly protein TadD